MAIMIKTALYLLNTLVLGLCFACTNQPSNAANSPGKLVSNCFGKLVTPVILDNRIAHSLKIYNNTNQRNADFAQFECASKNYCSYHNLVMSKSTYRLDSVELNLIRREDLGVNEMDSTLVEFAEMCFNSPEDSINLFNNYNQLLISFPQTGFASVGSKKFEDLIVESIVRSKNLIMLNTIGAGTTGSQLNFSHIFIFEHKKDAEIIQHQPIYKKKQNTVWMKDNG